MKVKNPILKGFHPDPSVVCVDKTYYLACSTFEWFPGVVIYESSDLANWSLVTRPLDTRDKLDLIGVPDSCGVWAPCLSHDGEYFYLVFSNVKSFDGLWKDTPNYLIKSKSIKGPWSEPVFLSASGFDGSLFHDDDGCKWYLSMRIDHRDGIFFGGIMIQEYDHTNQRLVGESRLIFEGSELGITEGPHLYKRDGYYYLLTAEGGTEYGHAVSVARSQNIMGPYEMHPDNPLLSSRSNPLHPLQKTGHGDIFWSNDGACYITYLCGRPLTERGKCVLGRETALDIVDWPQGDWPRLQNGTRLASTEVELSLCKSQPEKTEELVNFTSDMLPDSYHSLRIPMSESWLRYQGGALRLKGQDSLSSCFRQSLLARRVQSFNCTYTIDMQFDARSFQQMAGLVCYYNTGHHYFFHLMGDSSDNMLLSLVRTDNFNTTELIKPYVKIERDKKIQLKAQIEFDIVKFFYKQGSDEWHYVGGEQDFSILSDDYIREGGDRYRAAFTGSFVGISCIDMHDKSAFANFYSLQYIES